MKQHKITTLIATIAALLLSCTATRQCVNCGPHPVPYPLSTGPDCGDPSYKIRCIGGILWFDALAGSSYMIKSINPTTRHIIIQPATLDRSACVSTDFHCEGIRLNETLPFAIATGNTIILLNCTINAPHAPPLDCSASSPCHSYIKDHKDAYACERVPTCCAYKTGGPHKEYEVRVRGSGGCAAYQSFVDFNGVSGTPGKGWPELGVAIEWVAPQEPVCKGPMDCNALLNSKCGVGPTSGGVQRCLCIAGFKWDPASGLCQGLGGRGQAQTQVQSQISTVAASLGGIITIAVVIGALLYKKQIEMKKKAKRTMNKKKKEIITSAKATPLSSRIFTGREIRKATNNFAEENLIGSGGFGEVFKGTFDDGSITAIKRAKLGSTKGIDQIQNEVRVLCQVNHRSLVRLLGCCLELEHPLLIYEYVSNGTLFDYLHRLPLVGVGERQPLKWHTRLKIAHQTAEGLSYLHSAAVPPIYHRDVKSSNILLDDKFDAKVSDFGLSRLVELAEENKSHIFTSAQGTLGYLDPEYYRNFQLTDKSDVYRFGVVLMELLTAQRAIDFNREEENVNLAVYAKKKIVEDRLMEVLDPLLKDGSSNVELETMKSLGYLAASCLDDQRQKRPSMKEVSDEIEYLINVVKGQGFKSKL